MGDNTFIVNMKVVGDISDARSNIDALQKSFSKLKLPDKIGDNLSKKIGEFYKEYDKYQKKVAEGIKTQGDYNQVEKSLNRMRSLYQDIGKEAGKVTKLDLSELIDTDSGNFKKIVDDIKNTIESINNIKVDPKSLTSAFDQIKNVTKNAKIVGKDGILGQLIGHLNTGDIDQAKKKLQELQAYAQKVTPRLTEEGKRAPGTLSVESYQSLVSALQIVSTAFDKAEADADPFIQKLKELQVQLEKDKAAASKDILGNANKFKDEARNVDSVTESLKRLHEEEFSFNREAQNIDRQIQSYFGLSQMIRKVGDIARDAFATVKELDKAMTQTAVVTNFSVGDMWDMLPTYTAQANQLGSTIRDVYEAATLYYQQGLNTNQAMGLANETLKMARIAGLEAAEATDMMTAALRGFNMEINQTSAQKINDVYSELAAITASDTAEIGSAMERTASIANSANMEFETTSAFLAQMIETTREAPENLGTAMKTIVARFQEMKQDPTKLVDSEGVAMDANKVDKALKTIGVQLMNTKGEFRDLDDVFLDIASRWDSLTQGQQRYIATIAAGSRQQSRFIAMMSNYERTMELVDAANNSAGASQRQFEKTLDSMEAKLNKLKNAWDQFTMGLMNNQILKFGVDALTEGFTIVNKLIDALSKLGKPFGLEGLNKSLLTLVTTLGMLNLGKKGARGLVMGGAAWFKGEGGFMKNFAQGWNTGKNGAAQKQGKIDAQGYRKGWTLGLPQNSLGQTIKNALNTKQINTNIGNNLIDQLIPPGSIDAAAKEDARLYLTKLAQDLKAGTLSEADLPGAIISGLGGNIGGIDIDESVLNADFMNKFKLLGGAQDGFQGLANSINNAGFSLQQFGSILEGTPLEGFGNILIKVGTILSTFSSILNTTKANFLGNIAIQSGAIKTTEGLSAAQMTEAGTAALATAAQSGHLAVLKLLGKALLSALKTFLPIIAIIGALVVAYKVLDHFIITNKEALESATDAAAAASEAYDSAKQEASELADSIEKIREADSAFDGLVVGTAAFNEQLVTANNQIMELIKKYPMLNDYLTTDKNGVMHISEEGLNAVKEYQRQLQANASALNIIQNADLNSEESRQKALQMRKVKGTDTTETYQQRVKEANLLEQQAEAQLKMAKMTAVNTALVDKEIHNREKVSSILADQYDARKKAVNLEGQSIHELRQQYADFYGYKYDKSTKKITDIEGNEIDVDNATIKEAVREITVITNFEADGKSLDSMLGHIDNTFSKTLGDTFEDSGHLFSDILSNNINIDDDLVKQVLQNPEKIQDAVDSLSTKEIAAVLGVTADVVAGAPDKYKNELVDKLTNNAINIAETQAQTYTDLATMMAQTVGTSVVDSNGNIIAQISENQKQLITEQLSKLTSEQKNILSSVGSALQEGAGVESMRTFIQQATDIYIGNSKQAIEDLDGIIKGVNWESPTARLKAYKDMIAEGVNPAVQELGHKLLNSTESANLLGEAFEEFYNSSDFQEIAENMDKFVDSTGKLNASSVQEMAEQCHSLNNLLETGTITAGGIAAALNALGSNGNLTLMDLNSHVLELLSTVNQLDDAIASAHSSIENFEWGIDTGEAEDFVKESAKKWNELYNNGEFGNPQLEAYAKYVLGEENYLKILQSHSGDLEATMNDVANYVNRYADGFDKAWNSLSEGSWKNKNISEELKDKGIQMYTQGDEIIWDPGTATTNELIQWLQEVEGVSEDMAKIMLEDWENYSPDFRAERIKNDFEAGLVNGGYIENRVDANGGLTVSQSELQTIANATNKSVEEVKSALIEKAQIDENQLHVLENIDENGQLLNESQQLSEDYNKSKVGADSQASWISAYEAYDKQGNIIPDAVELKNAISGAVSDGLSQDQAMYAAWTEAQKLQEEGGKFLYDGVELFSKDLTDFATFSDKIAEITENSQWTKVGEAIAQGYISYIRGTENFDSYNNFNTDWTSAKDGGEKSTVSSFNTGIDGAAAETELRQEMRAKAQESWSKLWQSIKEAFTPGQPTEDPRIAAAEQSRENWKVIWDSVKEALSSGSDIEDPKIEAAQKAKENWKSIWDAVKKAFTNSPSDTTINKPTQPKQQSNQNNNTVIQNQETTLIVHTEDSELDTTKAKIDAIVQAASQQQTLTIIANTGQSTNEALNSINKIKDATKGQNTINVNAKVKGKDDVNNLGTVVKNVKPKTVSITANVSGASKVTSLKNEINNLKNKDVYITTHKKTVQDGPGNAEGRNNKLSNNHLPILGSLAKGSRYGRLGPRGKGGLTLTGEKGYEIAWIPSESRSMILGAEGPQMINLPADAVVYTHEQSEDILKKRQTIEAGSHSRRKKNSSGTAGKNKKSKSKGKKSSSSSSSSSSSKNINNFSIQEVVRFNIDKKLTTLTDQIENRTKTIEKSLAKIGTRASDITKSVQDQIKALQQTASYQQQLYNSNKAQLNEYRKKKEIVSYTDNNGKSQQKTISVATYLNADGSINQAAIQKLSSNAEREAIYKQVSSVAKSLVDGMNNAQKAMTDAKAKIEELGKSISEAFYQWENELTEVYDLTQRINNETSLTDRFASQVELELSRLSAGFGNTAVSIENIRKALNRSNTTIKEQVDNQRQMIAARKKELDAALSYQDEVNKRKKFEQKTNWSSEAEKNATIEWAKELEKSAQLGAKYIKNIVEDLDGSIQYEIDWVQFNKDNEANPYSKETYEAIKKYLDELNDAAVEYNNAIKDQTDFIKDTYDTLREYQDTIGNFEETLISGVEELNKTTTEDAKRLSDSISNALKDLLDEVKSKLDERRKQEDNLKTEQDIARKQQQLAALRANTAGGNQVQIAQLEKEITEAQQSYQRTLEDQLLDKLQQQGDEAAKQRERLIELSEGQLDVAVSNNKELVKSWLKDPEQYKENIKEAWLAANNYDDKGDVGQLLLKQTFESEFAQLVTAVEQTGYKEGIEGIEDNTNTIIELLKTSSFIEADADVTTKNTESYENLVYGKSADAIAALREKGVSATVLKSKDYTAQDLASGGYTATEMAGAYSKTEIANSGGNFTAPDLRGAGFTADEAKNLAGITDFAELVSAYTLKELKGVVGAQDFADNNVSYQEARLAGYSANDLLNISQYATDANAEIKKAQAAASVKTTSTSTSTKTTTTTTKTNPYGKTSDIPRVIKKGGNKKDIQSLQWSLKQLGYYTGSKATIDGKWGLLTDAAVANFEKKLYGHVGNKQVGPQDKAGLRARGYKTGGIADYTGPAWLHGTPSKPELVLNAKDTQNFIALKDVLSKAMGSTSSIENAYGGDATYEININVDHLNNDYDVDKVAQRVKKIIVSDSLYRNVTQVRKFK